VLITGLAVLPLAATAAATLNAPIVQAQLFGDD